MRKQSFVICIFFILQNAILSFCQEHLNPQRVIYAIDCGSLSSTKSADGFIYKSDVNFALKTKSVDHRQNEEYKNINIELTEDDIVYKSERNADNSFIYYIPIERPDTYVLIFKFAEFIFTKPGARVFNIKFGDNVVVEGVDIFAEVGNFAAYDLYVEFELKDDEIFFQSHVCSNAYKFKDHKLIVEFEKTDKGSPKVDGIVLYKGKLEDTNYAFVKQSKENRKKEVINTKYQQKKTVIGNDSSQQDQV